MFCIGVYGGLGVLHKLAYESPPLYHTKSCVAMANFINKPISKLSILFVFAILIPGCILAYFSIQNIASQKELTEKRLLEQQNERATELAECFQDQLMGCAMAFFSRADRLYPLLQDVIVPLDSMDYVAQAFAVDNHGQFIWPHYVQHSELKNIPRKSQKFLHALARAEKSEFAESDLREAARLYRTASEVAGNETERATAINGLARVLSKSGLSKQAADRYRILADRYGSLMDDHGVSFAHYALHQFIQMFSHNPPEFIYEDIERILSRFVNGELALTDQTEVVLQEVSDWFANQGSRISAANDPIPQQIRLLREWITFVTQEGHAIQQYLLRRSTSVTPIRFGPFEAIVGRQEETPSLLLVKPSSDHSALLGFKVHLDRLRNEVLDKASKTSISFDVETIITSRNKAPQIAAHPLAIVKEISPMVPSWRVCIRPENPKVITRYISKRRWVYGTVLTFLIAGMFLGVVLVLRDLSREQHLARLRSDFVSNVTHELKTPLTSIRMFAETMRMGRIQKKSDQQEYLSIIVNEAERLTRLINTVLDFSKIERGQKLYRMGRINLSEVVTSALDAMRYTLEEQGFKLEAEIESGVFTTGDADAIEQAVLNLLSNAIKYSHTKKVVTVRLWTQDRSALIQVADQGMGIPESEQKRIFDQFYRAHVGHKQDTGGAGLGLTVVKHIVDAHKGEIRIESKVDEGSKFTMILPQIQISSQEEN